MAQPIRPHRTTVVVDSFFVADQSARTLARSVEDIDQRDVDLLAVARKVFDQTDDRVDARALVLDQTVLADVAARPNIAGIFDEFGIRTGSRESHLLIP